jgi:hypothetical protein
MQYKYLIFSSLICMDPLHFHLQTKFFVLSVLIINMFMIVQVVFQPYLGKNILFFSHILERTYYFLMSNDI